MKSLKEFYIRDDPVSRATAVGQVCEVSEESSSDSEGEGFDTACEGEVEDNEETKKLDCNCDKCHARESYCCSQFMKVKKECQEKGWILSIFVLSAYILLRCQMCD